MSRTGGKKKWRGGPVSRLTLVLVAIISALAGLVIGWISTGRFSPEWVGAMGQWVGGLGTIAALIWAVLIFRQEKTAEAEALSERERVHEKIANQVTCSASANSFNGKSVDAYRIHIRNPNSQAVVVKYLQAGNLGEFKNAFLIKEGGTQSINFRGVVGGFSRMPEPREFSERYPVTMRYEIDGRTWQRVGQGDPERIE